MRPTDEIIAHIRRGVAVGFVDLEVAEELCARSEQILFSALKMEGYVHEASKVLEKLSKKQ